MFQALILLAIATVAFAIPSADLPPSFIEPEKWIHPADFRQIKAQTGYRLPNNTKPESYVVSITTGIHKADFDYKGEVEIEIVAEEDTDNITLHMRYMTIREIKVFTLDAIPDVLEIEYVAYYEETEFLVIHLKKELKALMKYKIYVKYEGELRNYSRGIYRQSYVNPNGERRWLLATHFEPHAARSAFPCFDEPAKKAAITIKITHDPSYTAISNMPEAKNSPIYNDDGTITTFFDPTPLMSTYLTAFVVSDYANQGVESVPPNRVFSKSHMINQTDLALDIGVKVLTAIGEYLNVSYSLPKMDQVAVPAFGGAMENWGLVIYGEGSFFYNPESDVFRSKESVQTIVAHEFGHQWFGNLVGPRWWTYIWLNEGFANYFQWKGIDLVYPEMKMMELYVIHNIISIFGFDASPYTRPMTYYVEDLNGVSSVFDSIAYGKSGSVINMFSHAFTEESFVKGLNYYLTKVQYSDAAEEDLFEGLQKAVTEDKTLSDDLRVDTIMYSWTQQSGFPVLYVHHHADGVIEVVQERYFTNPATPSGDNLWWIPYNFVTKSDSSSPGTRPDGWIHERTTNITQSDSRKWKPDDWIVFNKEHTGYYRVMYDNNNYKRIADALARDSSILHTSTKTKLLNDVDNFIDTNRMTDFTQFLDFTRFLANETAYTPWYIANRILYIMDQQLSGTHIYDMFESYYRDLITKIYKSVGVDDVEGEFHHNKYVRPFAVRKACEKGVPDCLKDANDRLKLLIETGKEFHQNIYTELFCASLRGASEYDFEFVWRRLLYTQDQSMRNTYFGFLGCATSERILNRYLGSALNNTHELVDYREGELVRVITSVYQNGVKGLRVTIEFFGTNIDELKDTFSTYQLQQFFDGMAQRVNGRELGATFENLLELWSDTINPDIPMEYINRNLVWIDRYLDGIEHWLNQYFTN